MSYLQHHPKLCPPGFDWEAVHAHAPPIRLSTEATAVHALSAPQSIERLRFDEPLPPPGLLPSAVLTDYA